MKNHVWVIEIKLNKWTPWGIYFRRMAAWKDLPNHRENCTAHKFRIKKYVSD